MAFLSLGPDQSQRLSFSAVETWFSRSRTGSGQLFGVIPDGIEALRIGHPSNSIPTGSLAHIVGFE